MVLVMVFLKNALMCIKKVKLINHDCLPILMLLYIMLYIVLAYLMLYIVLAYLMLFVCIMLLFLPMIFENAFYFHVLSWFMDTVCLFHVLICIMHSAFNLLVFPYAMFTPLLFLFIERAMCSPYI